MAVELQLSDLDLSAIIQPGDTVLWSQGTGEPLTLTTALVRQRERIGKIRVFLGTSFSDTLLPEHADFISFRGLGALGNHRILAKHGLIEVIPCHLSELPAFIESKTIPVDVVFVQISAADGEGNHSFGLVNDYIEAAMRHARVVIAEVNDQVPWTYGHPVNWDDIDYFVTTSRPLLTMPSHPIGPVDRMIARHVKSLIPDGGVLQIGIGSTPDAILEELGDKRDLGVHSGMINDRIAELMKAGVINNRRKEIDNGVTVTGVLFGTDFLYKFAHKNPAIQLRPVSYTHNPSVISKLTHFISINSAIEVDLSGQVNAEVIGGRYVGAVGGQLDFVRAAHQSRGGRSIIVLPSTARGGTVSRIVPRLSGGVTTTPRSDVDLVVTEYGIADLRGQSLDERARRLIAIAHPDFRKQLIASAMTT
ncbi:MAG: acetyl-CoA hydrolase/transferase C-terminal domain-containing protein [Alicyclobacillaceae bacterium]|nr:acetyl-CoA hydrolase/transferase C-terminal domain-containing protein [Alicyclobacillaceae bacterium]